MGAEVPCYSFSRHDSKGVCTFEGHDLPRNENFYIKHAKTTTESPLVQNGLPPPAPGLSSLVRRDGCKVTGGGKSPHFHDRCQAYNTHLTNGGLSFYTLRLNFSKTEIQSHGREGCIQKREKQSQPDKQTTHTHARTHARTHTPPSPHRAQRQAPASREPACGSGVTFQGKRCIDRRFALVL